MDWMVLLPPSRGVRDGGDPSVTWAATTLAEGSAGRARRAVVAAARRLRGEALAQAIGGASAVPAARRLLRDIHRAPTMAAVERYAGVVYDRLDVASLDPGARRRAHDHVGIPSALFGPLRGADPIPPYRLLMLATLPDVGRLGTFWRPHMAAFLDAHLDPGARVVDLLSSEYAAAVPPGARDGRTWITVDLVDATGKRVPAAIGKQAKGTLARRLLASGTIGPDAIDGDGLRVREVTDTRWVVEVAAWS